MEWKIPMFKIHWEEEDIQSVEAVIRRGTYWATGPEITQFEEKLADFVDRKYALTFNSGTSALHAILQAYDIKSSEVIVPSFTFIATANAVLLAGGKPIFAEVEEDSFGLDANDVNERITKKTKAIIPMHYGGQPCKEIKELMNISNDNSILLIEDAAQSFGSYIDKYNVGNFGDSAMFSLCQNKIITTGEGGFITTDNETLYEKLKLIRSHGRLEKRGFDYFSNTEDNEYIEIGYNFRMATMLAALGLSQLRNISEVIDMRRKNAKYLNDNLKDLSNIQVPIAYNDAFHIYQMYTIKLQSNELRESLHKHLTKKGIMSKVYFKPIHLKEFYSSKYGYKIGDLPKTEELAGKILTLPMYPDLLKDDLDYMIQSIREVI
ncbi:MAG: DegT/DnrJ/EryC1/StrS family aminotransferase [Candidatus Heimdallarchaeota archaeon]